jgi:hypothetical protein
MERHDVALYFSFVPIHCISFVGGNLMARLHLRCGHSLVLKDRSVYFLNRLSVSLWAHGRTLEKHSRRGKKYFDDARKTVLLCKLIHVSKNIVGETTSAYRTAFIGRFRTFRRSLHALAPANRRLYCAFTVPVENR